MLVKSVVRLGTLCLVVGCGPKHVPEVNQAQALERGVPVLASAVPTDGVAFPGIRLQDRVGAPEAGAVGDAVEALIASCPTFAPRLMWLECGESPCHAYVWGLDAHQPESWESLSCQGDAPALPGEYVGQVSVGGERMVEASVHALGSDTSTDITALGARFRPAQAEVDLLDSVLAEVAPQP